MRELLRGVAVVLCLVLVTQEASANCKIHSAKWQKGKSLKVSIPNRANPGKVLVDWTAAIKNGRCADRFNVFVWETHRGETFTRNFTAPKGTYSRVVDLDPCVEFKIKVGFSEDNMFGKEKENSTVSTFKTEASPTLGSGTNKDGFVVQVYFDKVTQKIDYSKASIRFPKSLLQHTSCLKHIEASGVENPATLTSSRGYNSHFTNLADKTPLSRSSSRSSTSSRSSHGGSGQYGSTSSLSSSGSYGGYGSYGTSGSFGGSGVFGGSGSYGGSGSVGGSHGGSGSYGGSGVHKPSGSSGQFLGKFTGTAGNTGNSAMDPYNYHDGHMHHDHSFGNHGRADFDKVSQRRFKRGLFAKKTTTPSTHGYNTRSKTKKPSKHTTTHRPVSGSTVSAKILPPFVEDVIEIVVPIKPCSSYTFSVKFISPQGATLGTVKDLKLPQLHEMHHYHPPTLTEVFKVGKPTSANAPFISLQTYSGIPVECVFPILKAVDRHMGHLEDELHFHLKKEFDSIDYGNKMKSKFIGQKEHSLESAGCECATPLLHFNTTDVKQLKKHKADGLFGTFVYEGMQNGRPYYRRPPTGMDVSPAAGKKGKKQRHKRFVGKVGNNTPPRSGSFSGGFAHQGSTSSSDSGHLVIPNTPVIKDPPPPGKVYFVYWNPQEKAWWVGKTLQDSKPIYKTAKNSPAKCPGDTKTVKKWEAHHTFSWKVDPHMVMTCKKQFH